LPLQLYEKEQILDACFGVFVRYGYMNASTAMLAKAAGVSKALIFHHFKSKKELYLSVLERCFEKMAPEIFADSLSEYQDFFEAKGKSGFRKIDYLKKNPYVNKVMFEAFYSTPDELKADIDQFKADIEEKYGALLAARDKWMKQLFEKVPLREGVDREQAFELIGITMDYFKKKCLLELTDENKLLDETYWQCFFDKKNSFLNMIRYGIEQKRD
jgi:AcrR family transcriptional regulator